MDKLEKLVGRNLIVVFDSTDMIVSRVLVKEEDYKEWGIPYPDSLKWIKELIED